MKKMKKIFKDNPNWIVQMSNPKEIYILFHDLTEKLQKPKAGISMHWESLAKSFKIARPTWFQSLQGIFDFQQPQ